ncbi:MAG: tetratricopeptide repeat protein, partial [Planctomycetota bacterium]
NRYLLGRAYGLAREYEKARVEFERVLERDIRSPLGYHGLGAYFFSKRDVEAAEKNFRKAVELDPAFTRARVELGKLLLTKQDAAGARRQLLKVLDVEPGNNEVRFLLASLLLSEQRWRQASEELLVVLSKEPDHLGAMRGLAIIAAMEKKTDEAIEGFEKVLARDPRNIECYRYLTRLYLDKGDKKKAIGVLERLLKVVPEGSDIATVVQASVEELRSGRLPPNAPVTWAILLEQLKTGSVEVRREAMAMIVAEGRRRGFPAPPGAVLGAVKDEDPVVRSMAIKWLGEFGQPELLPLLEILARHPTDREKDEKVRATTVQAIGKTGDAAGIPVLLAVVVEDRSFRVYGAAIAALRDLSGMVLAEDALAPLKPEEREALVRKWNDWWLGRRALARKLDAIETVGSLRSARMGRYVVPLLADSEELVTVRTWDALVKVTGEKFGSAEDLKTSEGRAGLMKQALVALKKFERKPKRVAKPAK